MLGRIGADEGGTDPNAGDAWFIGSSRDVDLEGFHGDDPIAQMRVHFPDLRDVQMIADAGHMVQLEAAAEVNRILLDYLARICTPGT